MARLRFVIKQMVQWGITLGMLYGGVLAWYSFFVPSRIDPSELIEIQGHLKHAERINMRVTNDGYWLDFQLDEYPYRFRHERLGMWKAKDFEYEPIGTLVTFSVKKENFPPKRETEVVDAVYLSSPNEVYMDPAGLALKDRVSAIVAGVLLLVAGVLCGIGSWKDVRKNSVARE
jgi:hypothetical protein